MSRGDLQEMGNLKLLVNAKFKSAESMPKMG